MMQNAELSRQFREDFYGFEDERPQLCPFLKIAARFAETRRAIAELRTLPELKDDPAYIAQAEAVLVSGAKLLADELNDELRSWNPGGFFGLAPSQMH